MINDVDFWWAFLDGKRDIPLSVLMFELLHDKLPPTVFNKTELMLQLCKYDAQIYVIIPQGSSLKGDAQLVEFLLAGNPDLVDQLSGNLLGSFHLVGNALSRLPLWASGYGDSVRNSIESAAWKNRDNVLGWAKGGGELHDLIPQCLREDSEIILTSIGKDESSTTWRFEFPDHRKGDKEFMLEAAKKIRSQCNAWRNI